VTGILSKYLHERFRVQKSSGCYFNS